MKKVIFIGQAMPRAKRDLHDWPTLNAWLYSIGITQDQIKTNFHYSALVDYFPGSKGSSHLVPTPEEINKEHSRLVKTIRDFGPQLIVCIGKLSISHCLNKKDIDLSKMIGEIFNVDPYGALGRKLLTIPLPHPSGASTWRYKPENKKLLNKALELLKNNI